MAIMQILVISPSIGISRNQSHSSFSGTKRETPLEMKISLINVSVSYKRVTSQFSELFLCPLFFKSNQPKIIHVPKRYILGQNILLLFRTILGHTQDLSVIELKDRQLKEDGEVRAKPLHCIAPSASTLFDQET